VSHHPQIVTPVEPKPCPTGVLTTAEQMPTFPNGEKALFKYLGEHIKYPAVARENTIEGTVYLGFVVDEMGAITQVTVKRSVKGGCDEEAKRVVQSMPRWNPGRHGGCNVKVSFTLPVKFKLD
jgi:protein TonB